jgi:hypothetical protein
MGTAFWDNVTLEVMPGGRPMYTMTEDFTPVKWQQSVPEWFVTLDPQTGKITRYHLDNIPGWASRVFSAQMAKLYLTWWGGWQLKPWDKKGSSGRFVVDTTLAGALDQLDRAAAAGQIDNNPVAKATKKSVAGVVERVGPPGGAYLVFKLKGDPHFYKVSLSGAASDSDELLLMNPGDDVVVTYNDTGKRDRYVKQVSDLNIEPPVRPGAAPSSSPTVPAGR